MCLFVVTAFHLVTAQNSTNATYDVLDYVDQLIGSSNGGLDKAAVENRLQC